MIFFADVLSNCGGCSIAISQADLRDSRLTHQVAFHGTITTRTNEQVRCLTRPQDKDQDKFDPFQFLVCAGRVALPTSALAWERRDFVRVFQFRWDEPKRQPWRRFTSRSVHGGSSLKRPIEQVTKSHDSSFHHYPAYLHRTKTPLRVR